VRLKKISTSFSNWERDGELWSWWTKQTCTLSNVLPRISSETVLYLVYYRCLSLWLMVLANSREKYFFDPSNTSAASFFSPLTVSGLLTTPSSLAYTLRCTISGWAMNTEARYGRRISTAWPTKAPSQLLPVRLCISYQILMRELSNGTAERFGMHFRLR